MSEAPDDSEETEVPGGKTRWTLIIAAQGEGAEAERALEELVQLYWRPLYAYARRKGRSHEDAEDAVQSFLAEKVVLGPLVQKADRAKGSFRALLRRAMEDWMTSGYRLATAEKRGGTAGTLSLEGMPEYYAQIPAETLTAEEVFDHAWAIEILHRAMEHLAATAGDAETPQLLEFLREGTPQEKRAALAERLGVSGNYLAQKLHRLRYGSIPRAMRAELGEQCSPQAFPQEWAYLCELLGIPPNSGA